MKTVTRTLFATACGLGLATACATAEPATPSAPVPATLVPIGAKSAQLRLITFPLTQ